MENSSSRNKSNGLESISHSGRFCSSFTTRSSSPTRVNHHKASNPPPYSSTSSNHQKKRCACSPTTHRGSFRCSLHRNQNQYQNRNSSSSSKNNNNHLSMRRSAMTNSLVRIGTVERELLKRALAAMIRPSSHHLRRRGEFQPKPSRLSNPNISQRSESSLRFMKYS